MSEETIIMPVTKLGASDYVLHASYSAPAHQGTNEGARSYTEHRFSSDNTFPDLNEYSKIDITDAGQFSSLSFDKQGMASLRLVEASGSFKNVLGHYQVDRSGTIHNVEIAFNNTRSKQIEGVHQFGINAGNNVHLFVVANGFSLNKEFSEKNIEHGEFSFLYKFSQEGERLAKTTDPSSDVTLVYMKGENEPVEIRGPVYHTTNDGIREDVNVDSHNHAVSGFVDDETDNVLRVGFEDFPGLGDADYNDVVVDLKVVYSIASSHDVHNPEEALYGQEDSIPLYDEKNIERDALQETNGFSPDLNNGFDSNLDIALNDEGEADRINIDDVLILDPDVIGDIAMSSVDAAENTYGLGTGASAHGETNAGIVVSGVESGLSDLEALLETIA